MYFVEMKASYKKKRKKEGIRVKKQKENIICFIPNKEIIFLKYEQRRKVDKKQQYSNIFLFHAIKAMYRKSKIYHY